MRLVNTIVFITALIVPAALLAQHEDCDLAQVICSNGPIMFNSEGAGINDFLDPGNHAGCLLTFENQSSWYYFEFTPDMPENSMIEFTIEPNGGFTEDYDFAIYGPNVPCDDLDFPVRCSFANFLCDLCPLTGLGMGATDNSEGAQGEDGFVAPLIVQPGEGYYLILDNWYGSSDGFTLTWGGSAAPFLNCSANPMCNNLTVNAGVDLNICAGDSLMLTASLSNASPNATIIWTDTTGANLMLSDSTALQPTFYAPADWNGTLTFTVTVTDGECQKSDMVTIGVDSIPDIQIQGESLHCPNTTASLSAENGYSAYQWSNDSTSQNIEIDTAGIYWLSATDLNGCTGIDTIFVEEAVIELPLIQGIDQICAGDSSQLSLNTTYESYLWNDNSTDSTLTAMTEGIYSVAVTDSNACVSEAFFTLNINPLPQPTISGLDTICMGEIASLAVDSSFANYLWSDSTENSEIEASLAGDYGVTVMDAQGCVGSTSFNLAVNPAPTPSILSGPAFCPGDSTPVRVNIGYVTYLWSNGETDNVAYALDGGPFSVTVTNDNGCEGSTSIDVNQFDAPEPEILGDTVFCAGNSVNLTSSGMYQSYLWSDGTMSNDLEVNNPGPVNLTVTDGNGCQGSASVDVQMNPLPAFNISGNLAYCENDSTLLTVPDEFSNYLWSDGSEDTILVVNTPGTYGLTITDANGCQEEESLMIIENALPEPQITGDLNYCPGESTTLGLTTAFLAYSWSDNSENSTLLVNNPGEYSVTVTDNNNCQGFTSEIINQFPSVELQIVGDTAYCAQQSTLLDAGSGFVSYLWSDNSMQSSLEVSNPGMYSVMVIDTNGCQATQSLNIIENALPVPTIQGGNGYCPGETLNLSATQNWEAYEWSNSGLGAEISVNTPGLYQLTVTDNNGCMGTTSQDVVAFPEPSPLIVGALQFCPDTETILMVNNSYAIYNWSDNSSAPSLLVNTPGTYSLTVTDNNGCSAITMEEVSTFMVEPPQIPQPLGFCAGQSIMVDAGTDYQSYLWTDGSNNSVLEISEANAYGVTVIDQNDCESSTNFTVEEYQLPQPDIQSIEGLCPGESTTLFTTGSFVTYLWTGGGQDSELMINNPGMYQLIVRDENACEGTDSVEILAYENPEPQIEGVNEICPNDTTLLTLSESYSSYEWTGGFDTPTLNVSEPGIIEVTVINSEGCTGQTSQEIIGLNAPEFDIDGDTTFCAGGNTLLSVPSQFADYQWFPAGEFPELQVSQAGMYSVTITNDVGCSANQSVTVAEIALPEPDVGALNQTLDCNFRVVSLGGTVPLSSDRYIYMWNGPGINANNQNMPQPEVGEAGIYHLVVEDQIYGCLSETIEFEVEDLSYEPEVVLEPVALLNCAIESAIIDGTASESLPAIQYQWFDASGPLSITEEAQLLVSEGGWYYLMVLDTSTGCESIDSIFVEEDRNYPTVEIAMPGILNCYETTLDLDGASSSNGPGFNFQWTTPNGNILDGENTLLPTVDAPGWYVLGLQNELNHCMAFDSVQVYQDIEPPVANAGGNLALDCLQREISLDGSASSVGPNFRYYWTDETGIPLEEADQINPMVAQEGLYYLRVTNLENGCTETDEVLISDEADYPTLAEIDLIHPECFGEESGQIIIETVENGTPPYLFALNENVLTGQSTFQNLSAGAYELNIEDAAGCTLAIPIIIEDGSQLEIDLGADRQINLGDTLGLTPTLTLPGIGTVQYDWLTIDGDSCTNCNKWGLRPFETQDVQVIATDEQGCISVDWVTIFVAHPDEVYIPNAFSPNDDGVNDLFMVYAGEDVLQIRSMMIMDRWGGNVFEAYDLLPNEETNGWDGRIRGEKASPAVFAYLIEVEFIDGDTKIFKGDVTLIR